ncbi:MAG: hypothetical protein ACYDCL_20445 [Myxococcales bacterium]
MDQTADETWSRKGQLRTLARRHAVRYEVLRELQPIGGALTPVGFDLRLWGLHEHPQGTMPGCPECVKVYAALKEIATWTLPEERRPSWYQIQPFDATLRVSPENRQRDEVLLEVQILHRHEFLSPIDSCEERCLAEMREKLAELGVPEGRRS